MHGKKNWRIMRYVGIERSVNNILLDAFRVNLELTDRRSFVGFRRRDIGTLRMIAIL